MEVDSSPNFFLFLNYFFELNRTNFISCFYVVDIFGENIIVLNSLLYTDIVENSVSDVLIDFYAPWCSICVENKPVYQELARRVKQVLFLLKYNCC